MRKLTIYEEGYLTALNDYVGGISAQKAAEKRFLFRRGWTVDEIAIFQGEKNEPDPEQPKRTPGFEHIKPKL
jgi:hypothetical protein